MVPCVFSYFIIFQKGEQHFVSEQLKQKKKKYIKKQSVCEKWAVKVWTLAVIQLKQKQNNDKKIFSSYSL